MDKRNNLIIEYPGTHPDRVVSFVGSHMDVVPANPEEWDRGATSVQCFFVHTTEHFLFLPLHSDPFKLAIEGDRMYGRGTTDCLGHVALITDMMANVSGFPS